MFGTDSSETWRFSGSGMPWYTFCRLGGGSNTDISFFFRKRVESEPRYRSDRKEKRLGACDILLNATKGELDAGAAAQPPYVNAFRFVKGLSPEPRRGRWIPGSCEQSSAWSTPVSPLGSKGVSQPQLKHRDRENIRIGARYRGDTPSRPLDRVDYFTLVQYIYSSDPPCVSPPPIPPPHYLQRLQCRSTNTPGSLPLVSCRTPRTPPTCPSHLSKENVLSSSSQQTQGHPSQLTPAPAHSSSLLTP